MHVVDLPEPHAGAGEVRIRVHAASVNPTDRLFRAGSQVARLSERPGPSVPGMDAAGVIDELGSDTDSRLKVGDRVVALVIPAGPHGGTYAEYVVVPAPSVVLAPAGVDFPAASTLLLNGLTARLALDALALDAGQTMAVATLWMVSVGGEADAGHPASTLAALPLTHIARTLNKGRKQPRKMSCFARGIMLITLVLWQGQRLPTGQFVPFSWPTPGRNILLFWQQHPALQPLRHSAFLSTRHPASSLATARLSPANKQKGDEIVWHRNDHPDPPKK